MAGPDPAIHVFFDTAKQMPGAGPGMTNHINCDAWKINPARSDIS
jgi:hypothetical protein